MNDFLLPFGTLYHFSPSGNSASIQTHGIRPRLYPWNEYDTLAPEQLAQSCICDLEKLKGYVHDERVANHPDPVVCVINPIELQGLRMGLDWTHGGTRYLFDESTTPFILITSLAHQQFGTASLETLGTICCFDVIPPSAFEIRTAEEVLGTRPAQYPVGQ